MKHSINKWAWTYIILTSGHKHANRYEHNKQHEQINMKIHNVENGQTGLTHTKIYTFLHVKFL